MTCKGCGNRIPEKYLRLDSFKCPSCGKPYKRIASHHTSKPISAPRRDESLHASGMSRSSSQKAPVESKHKLSIAAFMFLLGIIFIIIGTVIGGAAPAILIPLGVSLICFGIVIAYFTSQKSGASKSKGTGTTCHSHVIGNRAKPFVISISWRWSFPLPRRCPPARRGSAPGTRTISCRGHNMAVCAVPGQIGSPPARRSPCRARLCSRRLCIPLPCKFLPFCVYMAKGAESPVTPPFSCTAAGYMPSPRRPTQPGLYCCTASAAP